MGHRVEGIVHSLRIALIDDDKFQLKLLSHQLSIVGYRHVRAFDDSQTALEYLLGQNLDSTLIILDLHMPNLDASKFMQALREVGFGGALLFVAAEDDSALISAQSEAADLNVLGHVSKPVQQERLQKFLQSLANERERSGREKKQHDYAPARLQRAIAAGELVNYYQPKVNLETGALVGVEALVRWEHPEDGVIAPDKFIDLAEENRLIDSIAQQVLRNAMTDSMLWKEEGLDLSIAVNISMYNLNTKEFLGFLENELLSSGVNPQDLTLEVRESELLRDYALVLDMLTRLRLRRVNLSIDDFGTGQASVSELRNLPFNELKIDRGFVHSVGENKALLGVFDGSIKLAKNLGIKTVAEGVENEADWVFLGGRGCDLAQGFFIGKPMRALELSDWNAQWAQRYAEISVQAAD